MSPALSQPGNASTQVERIRRSLSSSGASPSGDAAGGGGRGGSGAAVLFGSFSVYVRSVPERRALPLAGSSGPQGDVLYAATPVFSKYLPNAVCPRKVKMLARRLLRQPR